MIENRNKYKNNNKKGYISVFGEIPKISTKLDIDLNLYFAIFPLIIGVNSRKSNQIDS